MLVGPPIVMPESGSYFAGAGAILAEEARKEAAAAVIGQRLVARVKAARIKAVAMAKKIGPYQETDWTPSKAFAAAALITKLTCKRAASGDPGVPATEKVQSEIA